MGNSCVKGAGRSKPGLDLTSNATPSSGEQTSFKWIVDGFSSLLDKDQGWTYSNVFEIMGVQWYLKLNPKYKKIIGEKEYVSLRLELPHSSVKLDTIIEASFKLMIYDQSNGKHKEKLVNHRFQTASTTSGISCMSSLKTLNKQSSRFLVNNSCIFGIEFIKVATIKANTALETLFVRKMNVFNEAKVYTWEIEDFFALKNWSYSPEFEIGGYTWYITMYPSCDGNHLSLFLKMKKTNDVPKALGTWSNLLYPSKTRKTARTRNYQAGASSQTNILAGDGISSSHSRILRTHQRVISSKASVALWLKSQSMALPRQSTLSNLWPHD